MPNLPESVRRLLWDVEAATVDPVCQRNFLLDRVLEYGGIEALRWAEAAYGLDGIRDDFLARGDRVLTRKTRSFWRLILQLDDATCMRPFSAQPGNPLWPY